MIEIIPAIDIIEGKCVRLTQGDYNQKTKYSDTPLTVAKIFEDSGIKRLHLVDLDGAKSNHVVNLKVLEEIASKTSLTIDFGGGVKSTEDLQKSFDSGANMITIGSMAVKSPEIVSCWMEEYGHERFILGADVKKGKISINGWKEEGDEDLFTFLDKYISQGVRNVLCTDISRDGMLKGPSNELYRLIMERYPALNLIASGGVSSIDDIRHLNDMGIPSVVFGKAYYEGLISLEELKDFL
mgnify:CR=1 FL=1